jgi:hypothetical protein
MSNLGTSRASNRDLNRNKKILGCQVKEGMGPLVEYNHPTRLDNVTELSKAERKKLITQRVRSNKLLNGYSKITALAYDKK